MTRSNIVIVRLPPQYENVDHISFESASNCMRTQGVTLSFTIRTYKFTLILTLSKKRWVHLGRILTASI